MNMDSIPAVPSSNAIQPTTRFPMGRLGASHIPTRPELPDTSAPTRPTAVLIHERKTCRSKGASKVTTIWTAILSGIGALLLATFIAMVRLAWGTFKTVNLLIERGEKRSRQIRALFVINSNQTKVMRATLEVVAGIQNNGNVVKARECLNEIDATVQDFACAEAWN
jgi:hypothetical protein